MRFNFLLKNLTPAELQSAFPTLSAKLDLKRYFTLIEPDIAQVEDRIRFQAREFDPGIVGYIEYACESQGKRIRPALTMLTARATGTPTSGHLDLAVVVELIHLATLVHDDILDGATKRRGEPTVFSKWGAELSVLLGDCLFSHALKLCANFPTTQISRTIADAANEVCTGEILQTQRRFDLKLSIPEYLRIIEMKTAALFRVSTELSAVLSNAPADQIAACKTYGDSLGIAYQIYDDCLDLVGDENATGKTVGTDLAKGKLTLPLLHVLQQAQGEELQALSEIILHGTPDDRMKLLALVLERGGLKASVRKIQSYLDQATGALELLPPSPARDALNAIPQALRDHVAVLMK